MGNKIVASVALAALLLTAACGEPASETTTPAAEAPAAAPAAPQPALTAANLPAPYNEADLDAGKQSYMIKCRACHAVEAAAGDMVGPNLDGVFQRKPGSKEGFRYSEAMVAFAAATPMTVWLPGEIDHWLEKPTEYLPGSAMFFNGMPDAVERRNLIGYLLAETAQ
jgi:cytochrome c